MSKIYRNQRKKIPLAKERTLGTSTRVRTDEKMETHQDSEGGDLPGSSVVKTLPPSARGVGLTLGQGPKITHAFQSKKQNIKQKQYCNKFNKAFKNETHTKVLKKQDALPLIS